jgi:hypothetical protein
MRRLPFTLAGLLLWAAALTGSEAVAQSPGPIVAEGEVLLDTAQASDGQFFRQEMAGFGSGWSGNAQLFWGASQPGAQLRLSPILPAAGPYEVKLFLTVAPDFGIAGISLGEQGTVSFDGYNNGVALREVTLGQLQLPAGLQELQLQVTGKSDLSTGYFMGIDRVEFHPVGVAAPQAAQQDAPGVAPGQNLQPWTTQDVIDSRIDVSAQYALMRMLAGEPQERIVSSNILSAVKEERLGGIYQEDQQVPALRAQASGYGWWQILPKSAAGAKADSKCMTDPASKAPIIVMRKKAETNPVAYDKALQDAWYACGLPPAPVRPYAKTLPNKQPAAKLIHCDVPGDTTQLVVEVIVQPKGGGEPAPAENAMVVVQGPAGFSASGPTNLEGIAEFELPTGDTIYQVAVSNLPNGYGEVSTKTFVIGKCRNERMVAVGWSRDEDPCAAADRTAQNDCWGKADVLDGMADCSFGFTNAQKTCLDYRDRQEGGDDGGAFEQCASWATATFNQCVAPIYESVARCYAEIRAKGGCEAM